MRHSRAFTIVELLIVIVVIAILAAIILILFNGLRERTTNQARIASTHEVYKLLQATVVSEGPDGLLAAMNPQNAFCLGTDYKDATLGNGNENACWSAVPAGDGTVFYNNANSTVNTITSRTGRIAMNDYPTFISNEVFTNHTFTQTGPYATYSLPNATTQPNVDNKGHKLAILRIYLDGPNQDCGFGRQLIQTGTVAGVRQYTTLDGAKNAGSGSTYTSCQYYIYPGEF